MRYEFTLWATPLPTVKDWRAAFDWPTEGENFLNWIRVKATNLGTHPGRGARATRPCWQPTLPRQPTWSAPLAPGRSAETCFRIPFTPVADAAAFDKEEPEALARPHRQLLARASWPKPPASKCPARKSTQALLAAHVCQLIANDHGVLHGGEGFYDEFYIRDGAYQVMELEEAGLFDAARKAIDAYLRAQRPDGRFETQKNQFDANGQALWTLWQYYKITGDRAWLEQAYPQMRRAADWTMQRPPRSPGRFALRRPAAQRRRRRRVPLGRQASHRRLRLLEPARAALHGRRRARAGRAGRRAGVTSRRPTTTAAPSTPPGRRPAWPGSRRAGRRTARTGATPRRSGPPSCSPPTTRASAPCSPRCASATAAASAKARSAGPAPRNPPSIPTCPPTPPWPR